MLEYEMKIFRLYYPEYADKIVDYYDNEDCSITVILDDGRKVMYDTETHGTRYIASSRTELTDHQIANEFKKRLRNRMRYKHITQERLSELTGIPQCSISMYTSGSRLPNLQSSFKIARALDCSIDDLIYKEPR